MKKLLAILVIFSVICVWLINPFKVTNPNDPKFDVKQFKFEDYNPKDLQNVLDIIFPEGMKKKEVDRILVDNVGAKSSIMHPDEKWVMYTHTNIWHSIDKLFSPGISVAGIYPVFVFYNESEEVNKVCVFNLKCSKKAEKEN